MMENPRPEEENIIKDIRNLFTLRKKTNYFAIKVVRNLFRLEKQTKAVRERIPRDNKDIFEHEEENYHKPVRASNFCSNNYIEYESNGDRNKILSVEKYLNMIRPHLKDIIHNLKKYGTSKTQLEIANDLFLPDVMRKNV